MVKMIRLTKKISQILIDKQFKQCCKTWVRFWLEGIRKFKCDEIQFDYCGGCGKKIKKITEKDLNEMDDKK